MRDGRRRTGPLPPSASHAGKSGSASRPWRGRDNYRVVSSWSGHASMCRGHPTTTDRAERSHRERLAAPDFRLRPAAAYSEVGRDRPGPSPPGDEFTIAISRSYKFTNWLSLTYCRHVHRRASAGSWTPSVRPRVRERQTVNASGGAERTAPLIRHFPSGDPVAQLIWGCRAEYTRRRAHRQHNRRRMRLPREPSTDGRPRLRRCPSPPTTS